VKAYGKIIGSLMLAAVFAPAMSAAQSLQTWVSGFGSDSNACTINAPCQTIAYALSVTSSGGEISILDAGPYFGPINITKSVTINGVSALGTLSAAAGNSVITVNAGPSDVVILRGLSFSGGSVAKSGGATNAVSFTSGGKLHIENSSASGFTSDAIYFAPTGNSQLYVNNVSFRNSFGAVYAVPGTSGKATVSVNNMRSENNSRGVRFDDNSFVEIRNSLVMGNDTGNAYSAVGTGARPIVMTIENSTASFNGASGVYASASNSGGTGATVRLHNVVLTDNFQYGVNALAGVSVVSSGTNRIAGNTSGSLSATTTNPLPSWDPN
jgi:hypothetical protein